MLLSKHRQQMIFQIVSCLSLLVSNGQSFIVKPCEQRRSPLLLIPVKEQLNQHFYSSASSNTGIRNLAATPTFFSVASSSNAIETETTSPEKYKDVLLDVAKEHEEEVLAGFQAFDTVPTVEDKDDNTEMIKRNVWSDDAFTSRSVGVGHAGPDEEVLCHGDEVFQTIDPVFSKYECEAIIAEAREIIATGLERDNTGGVEGEPEYRRTNSQLGEARVSTMPETSEWLKNNMRDKLFPLLESRFGGGGDGSDGSSKSVIRADELTLHDALVIGYGYFGCPTISQPIHRDTSIISLNVALSPSTDYVGGGTYFEGFDGTSVQNEQGHVLCHAGGAMHAGYSIEKGERWVLVLFVLAKNAPQLARRCHARGVWALRDGKLDEAEIALKAGLTVSPYDHLLHRDLGGVYMAKGDRESAKAELERTTEVYPLCQKSLIGLGSMLLEEGKPDEALVKFELALERMQDKDLLEEACVPLRADGYNARFNAAYCALLCADREATNDADARNNRKFGLNQLTITIERIRSCIAAAPGNGQLHSMMARAVELLEEAKRITNGS